MPRRGGQNLFRRDGQNLAAPSLPSLAEVAVRNRFWITLAAPMIIISLLLLMVGIAAARNVQNLQETNSELIAREVHGMWAAQDLYITIRDIRHYLNRYLRGHDPQLQKQIAGLQDETESHLMRAQALLRTPQEKKLLDSVERGNRHFFDEFHRVTHGPYTEETQRVLEKFADELLDQEIFNPVQEFLKIKRGVVDRTAETSRVTAAKMRQGFLLLGICGGIAGLLAGVGLARTVNRSIVQLDVSIRSAAGMLNEVTGPVRIAQAGSLKGMEHDLQLLQNQIGVVVERLQKREIELLRSEQLAALGQLAAGLAHELRNPLMPMKMLVQATLERGADAAIGGRQLQVINDEITRLESSIQAFLDFARPPQLEPIELDLNTLIRQSFDLISVRAYQQDILLRSELPPAPSHIKADTNQIKQLLLNLLLNSLDAMPQGGEITLHMSLGNLPRKEARRSAAVQLDIPASDRLNTRHLRTLFDEPDSGPNELPASALRYLSDDEHLDLDAEPCYIIRIVDNGPGFSPDVLDRIFEPFVSTKETGTGLGLSICRHIVMAHGGAIRAANRAQGGAEFTIWLPYEASSTTSTKDMHEHSLSGI